MIRRRRQKATNVHYGLLANKSSYSYSPTQIDRFVSAIQKNGSGYTVLEPRSAMELYQQGRMLVGLAEPDQYVRRHLGRRGKVTTLIACGGDGTFNLASRIALEAGIPVGSLPMGRFNNMMRSVISGPIDGDGMVERLVKLDYRHIDVGVVAGQQFFGSIGFGFVCQLTSMLAQARTPRFGIGWSQLGSRAAAEVEPRQMVIKVDSFRFEATPTILNINLLPYSSGLSLSPGSRFDDRKLEIVFDIMPGNADFSSYTRKLYGRKYEYGRDVRLYRGQSINIQPTNGLTMYLDGELVFVTSDMLTVALEEKQLKVVC